MPRGRRPWLTRADVEFLERIWKFRGYLSSWVWEDRLFGNSRSYTFQRIGELRNRGYIVSRLPKHRRWNRHRVWYLTPQGLEEVGKYRGWVSERLESEVARWKRWRNDEDHAQWRRLWAAEIGRVCERRGWEWLSKQDILDWHPDWFEELHELGSAVSGGIQIGGDVYVLYVADSFGGTGWLSRLSNEVRQLLLRELSAKIIIACIDEYSYFSLTPAYYGEVVIPYEYALYVLEREGMNVLLSFKHTDYVSWKGVASDEGKQTISG